MMDQTQNIQYIKFYNTSEISMITDSSGRGQPVCSDVCLFDIVSVNTRELENSTAAI
jgi:hypothetical protein